MSEMAPEQPGRKENVFTRKIGPLSMWVWVVIIGSAIVAYSLYKRKTASATATPGTATGTDASQVPQFVNQTYTNPTAPVAGPPGPAGPPGAHGPSGAPGPVVITGNVFHPKPPLPQPPTSNWPGGRQPGTNVPSVRSERLKHKGNLLQIANRNGIDLEDLLEANPELQKYKGTGKLLPVGTVIRIPPKAA